MELSHLGWIKYILKHVQFTFNVSKYTKKENEINGIKIKSIHIIQYPVYRVTGNEFYLSGCQGQYCGLIYHINFHLPTRRRV